ncbi:hypothetical protein GGI21_000339 [Coemansia aciculifera]|nr:hypothetical protein GGI21_000339 [Coemansia aciculifera]
MTDYILVTLQNEMSEAELREHCMTDLLEFFGEQTSVFVTSLFEALGRKQYLPENMRDGGGPATTEQRRENGHTSRRRSRSPDHRHDRSSMRERERDRRGRSSRSPSRERRMQPPPLYQHDMTMLNGPLEPADGNLMFAQIQQQQNQPFQQRRQRKPCFEFMRRGNCQRGDACTYAHVTQEQAQMMGMATASGGVGAFVPMQMQQQQQQQRPFMMGHQQQQRPPGGYYPMGMRPPPGVHMQQGGNFDNGQPMSTTAVFVTNIPEDSLSEASVREFFERFGGIQELRIDSSRSTAFVEYGDSGAQAQALSTPEAIFNNRFVRVHKARLQQHQLNGDNGSQQRQSAPAVQAPPVWRPKSATIKKAEMIEKYVEQQKELMKKLTTIKDMPPATRKIIMDSINQIQKKIDEIRRPASAAASSVPAKPTNDEGGDSSSGAPNEASSSTVNPGVSAVEAEKQALQMRLKALQKETAQLKAASHGGGSHRAAMSLDKRPRTLVLRNVGQAAAERLDSEMAQFGEIEHIDKTEDRNDPPFTYAVKFKARWEAEAAMKAVSSLDAFSDVSADWDHS